ncbi:Alpha-(1,3)-fucosyltransferase 7 [Sparganum proliferum]
MRRASKANCRALILLFLFILVYRLSDTAVLVEMLVESISAMLPSRLSAETLRNLSIYRNRYCARRDLLQTGYGYASVIQQMQWINTNDVKADDNDGPLIFYDDRYLWHTLSADGCEYKCRFSTWLSDYPDAVLAVFTQDPPTEALPKPKNQIWALESGESPFHMPQISPFLQKNFTVFLTTRSDSPVPWVYAVFVANEDPERIVPPKEQLRLLEENSVRWLPEQHRNRQGKVVALVSNWDPRNGRTGYIAELSQYISVDIYGRSHRPCPEGDDNCLQYLSLNYKFYLAFENSNCKDYITEKLFINALRHSMLPVVMGAPRDDYCALAPPNSFIHVDDFESPAKLASYLNWLDRNDTAYASYFAWKAYGKIVSETRTECRLCGFLHQHLKGLASIPTKGFNYFTDPSGQCERF